MVKSNNTLSERIKNIFSTCVISRMTKLDLYIIKQFLEVFVLGMVVFMGLVFSSDTFLQLIKKISNFGMPLHIALMIVLLNLPAIVVFSIPMSSLFATIMVLNKLSLNSEITVLKACGIGLHRISLSILLCAVFLCGLSFFINEAIVPVTQQQSKTLGLWALGQKNVPNGKHNFVIKEEDKDTYKLKRLFFVDKCENDKLYNIVVLDMAKDKKTNLSYAKTGKIVKEGWALEKGLSYTIDGGKSENNTNTLFETTIADFGLDIKKEAEKKKINEYNIIALHKFIEKQKHKELTQKEINSYKVMYYDKIALPVTTLVLVLIGIPLAITPPRVRYNRGMLFSIMILFLFYVIRAFSMSLGESGKLPPMVAVWLPEIVVGLLGLYLYWKKSFKIT